MLEARCLDTRLDFIIQTAQLEIGKNTAEQL